MAQIISTSAPDSRVGSSFEQFTLKLDLDNPKGGVGPPSNIEVGYSVFRDWTKETAQGHITKIDDFQPSPPIPIVLHMLAWYYKGYSIFKGSGSTGVPIRHYTVEVHPGWLLEKGNEKFALIQADKEICYKTANWGKEQQEIINEINK